MQALPWFVSIPPVTRTFVMACVITSLSEAWGLIHHLQLYLNWRQIFHHYQVWRFLTNFLYFGSTVNLIFKIFCVVQYMQSLEQSVFRRRVADYVYMIMFGAFSLLFASFCLYYMKFRHPLFLGPVLTEMIVYIWAKHHPYIMLHFLGILPIAAPLLPWIIFSIEMCFELDADIFNLMGFFLGHLYYFLSHVYVITSNRQLLKTPAILRLLLD